MAFREEVKFSSPWRFLHGPSVEADYSVWASTLGRAVPLSATVHCWVLHPVCEAEPPGSQQPHCIGGTCKGSSWTFLAGFAKNFNIHQKMSWPVDILVFSFKKKVRKPSDLGVTSSLKGRLFRLSRIARYTLFYMSKFGFSCLPSCNWQCL